MNVITKEINEVDTNQWNGLIHYAANGLPQAYKWYLKSISKDTEVAFLDDYFCGKVLVPSQLPRSIANLLPLTEYFVMDRAYYMEDDFPTSSYVSTLEEHKDKEQVSWYSLDFNKSAQQIESDYYTPETTKLLDELNPSDVTVTNGGKPDELISAYEVDNELERILVRIHYNAIQRSIAFSSAVVDNAGKHRASSLFVYSHNGLYEIMANPQSEPKYLAMMYHLICRNNAMKPTKLHFALENPFISTLYQNLDVRTISRSASLADPTRIDDGYRPRNLSDQKKGWLQRLFARRN